MGKPQPKELRRKGVIPEALTALWNAQARARYQRRTEEQKARDLEKWRLRDADPEVKKHRARLARERLALRGRPPAGKKPGEKQSKRAREKARESERAYRRRNPWIYSVKNANRKGYLRNAGRHTKAEVLDILVRQHGCCAYCGILLDRMQIDHKTPLSRGGSNTAENLCCCCADCNTRKWTMTESEFRARLGGIWEGAA